METGKILRLEFTHFAVVTCSACGSSTCHRDYVKITDGDGTTLMDNSCGYSSYNPSHPYYFQPPTITTRTNTVEIFFHTDHSGTQTGWSLTWVAVTTGSNDFIQLTSESFIHLNCHWCNIFYVKSMINQMNFRIHLEIFRICETQLWLFKVNVKVVEKATLPKTISSAFFCAGCIKKLSEMWWEKKAVHRTTARSKQSKM